MEELKSKLAELRAKKEAIDGACAPLVSRREDLWAEVHALKAEIDAIAAEEKRLKTDGDYWGLSKKIGQVADAIMAAKRVL